MNEKDNLKNIYILETALFIASSTREVIQWKQYGSLRLSQILIKFLNLPNEIDSLEQDPFLFEIKNEIENNIELRRDDEKYEKFLDSIIVKMMDEYKKRLEL